MSNAQAWSESSAISYYSEHRHDASDLYPSEKVFLPRVLFPGAKVLDVGCASGGFYNIMRSLEPSIEYTGIDIAEPAIALAKEKYPEGTFEVTGGVEIPFEDNSFDLVHCTSVLVVEPRYKEVLGEMYRVSNRFVLADMRLLKGIGDHQDFERSYYRIQFDNEVEQAKVPYVVSDADQVVNYILGLNPRPQALRGTGYFHEVTPNANTDFGKVCMTVFLIQKGNAGTVDTELDLQDLPLEFAIGPR